MTADKLIRTLALVDENIMFEAATQALKFMDAARYRVSKMRMRVRAEAELASFATSLELRLRARPEGDKRITEAWYKARIASHPKWLRLKRAVEDASEREELSKLILEAFRMRRDAIRVIAEAQVYEAGKTVSTFEQLQEKRKLQFQQRVLEKRRRVVSEDE
jgi:hypothetical protein